MILITISHQTGVALSYLSWALASTFSVFVLARVVGGLSKGNVSLAYSIMADILPEKTRSTGMVSAKTFFFITHKRLLKRTKQRH